jgi:hypothetical protein
MIIAAPAIFVWQETRISVSLPPLFETRLTATDQHQPPGSLARKKNKKDLERNAENTYLCRPLYSENVL